VAVLAIAALALLATSPPPPNLASHVIGEVMLGGGETAEREFRIRLDPSAGQPTRGSLTLAFQAANGLETAYTDDATLAFVAGVDAGGHPLPPDSIPVERCTAGCELTYRIRITAGRDVLPASVVRYEAGVRFDWDGGYRALDPSWLRIELAGSATGPVAPTWSLLAGLLALAAGIALGPRVDRLLPPARRTWPAFGLLGLVVAMMAWLVLGRLVLWLGMAGRIGLTPLVLVQLVDPWSLGLLATLAWGVRRGVGRWPKDGGWLLGVAVVAVVGLGGLWFASWSTYGPFVQPIVLGAQFALLGGLGGVVIGQAWRTDPRPRHDRWWAALSALGHGVVIAGFGFLAVQSLTDPVGGSPQSLLLLVPAALVAWAWRRWLRGRQGWLILFDVAIAAIGLLGLYLWTSLSSGFGAPSRIELGDVAVAIAVVAAVVAFATSLHALPRPEAAPRPPMLEAGPTAPPAGDPSTT
jgi:hypothetical protein